MRPRRRLYRIFIPLLILLVGAALRLHLLGTLLNTRAPLFADEALFATFARNAALDGGWWMPGALDKTPLALYAQAAFMTVFAQLSPANLLDLTIAQAELAARLPSLLAGIALPAAVMRAAYALYRDDRSAWAAGGLAALSPFALLFSPTAFTDMPMLLFATLALAFAAERRGIGTSIMLVLALLCKQQAVFFVPILLAIAIGYGWTGKTWARGLIALFAGVAVFFAWDAARSQVTGAVSVLQLASANNPVNRLIRSDEVAPRLDTWLNYGRAWFGGTTALWVGLGVFSLAGRVVSYPRRRDVWADMVLLIFALAYLFLHWLVAFNLYDRYLLPLLLPLALIAGRGALWLADVLRRLLPRGEAGFLPAVLWLALLVGTGQIANGGNALLPYSVTGSSFERRDGVEDLAVWINRQPLGTILYDRWLGWELGLYLGQWTDKRRVFYPTPDQLADGARAQPDPAPRLLVAPADEPLTLWIEALTATGFTVTPADDPALPRGYGVYWVTQGKEQD